MFQWVPFASAREALSEHLLNSRVETGYLEAAKSASRILLSALADGELQARPNPAEDFSLEFTSTAKSESIALTESGTIPVLFWTFWRESLQIGDRHLATIPGQTTASSFDDDFRFKLDEGLRNGGRMEGFAPRVELRRDQLPGGMPKPKGRPRGASKLAKEDESIALQCQREIAAGRPRSVAVKEYAPKMPGNATLDSKAARLRKLLRTMPLDLK